MNHINFSFLCGLVLICAVFADNREICYDRKETFLVCKRSNVITSVTELNTRNISERIFAKSLLLLDRGVSSIAENAFKNLSITVLMIDLGKGNLKLFPKSFAGLPLLRSLQFHSGIVVPEENLFQDITTVSSLGLTIDSSNISLKGTLESLPYLTRFKISESNLNVVKAQMFTNLRPAILYLTLVRNKITGFERGAFSPLKSLKSLQMYSNNLRSLQPGTFDGLDKLEVLEIGWDELESIPRYLFHGLNRLEKLSLIWNKITTIEVNAFSGMNIVDLTLDNNKLNKLEPGTFNGLAELSRLDIQSNNISIVPKNVFNGLQKLTDLNIVDNQISTIEVGAFTELDLWSLDLRDNKLTNISAEIFNGARIEELDLSNNRIVKIENGTFKDNEIKLLNLLNNAITVNRNAWGLSESTQIIASSK